MKTIFRYTNIAVLTAAFLVLGTVASFAQDPCADAEGQTTLGDKFRAEFADKSIEGRKKAIETGKQFLEKYGSCDSAKELGDYLKGQLPKMETALKALQDQKAKDDLTNPFDAALKAKDWDKVYALGKQILEKYPDEYRPVEIVLGSIGGEEAVTKANFKHADDALIFAKKSIADLEAGKPFVLANKPALGFSSFSYPNKDDAIGWLNYYIGFITNVVKKDKVGALPYLYKATQAASESKTKSVPYTFIGYYYAALGDKLADEIQALIKAQDPKDTEEVAKQKVDVIKARVALFNGTNERAADAFARALSRAPDAAAKAEIKKALDFSYNRRFGKMDGIDAWVANTVKQPFVNPTTPIEPISDPDPATPSTTTSTAPATPEVKPATPATKPQVPPAKPASTIPAKPAAAKPQAKAKKTVVKKKTA